MALAQSVLRRVLVVAAILIASIVFTLRHGERHVDVTTAQITKGSIVHPIVATGDLRAVETVDVGAQVSGTVRQIMVDYNSIVHAGQTLATIDPELFDAALREARAKLAEAEANALAARANATGLGTAAEDARQKLERTEQLSVAQIAMPSDLDAARATEQEAEAAVDGARSQIVEAEAAVAEARSAVQQAQLELTRTIITSPIDGVVVARSVDVGQTVASSFQAPVLFTIATDLRRLQLNVDIDESDIGGVRTGEPIAFTVETYGDERFTGRVSQVRLQPVAQQTVQATAPGGMPIGTGGEVPTVISYSAIADVPNPDGRLRPGLTATVSLEGLRRDDAVRLPNQALAFRPGADVLGVLGQPPEAPPTDSAARDPTARRVWRFDGTQFTPVDVRIGLSDGQWTELVSGPLGDGDSVVTGASVVTARRFRLPITR
jgi:HlyD family secretion protein